MDVPTARRDKVIQINKGRQQETGEYATQIARDRLPREDDDQHPREAAHGRVRRIVKCRARRLVLAVFQPEVTEHRTGANCARQKRARQELAPHRVYFSFFLLQIVAQRLQLNRDAIPRLAINPRSATIVNQTLTDDSPPSFRYAL